MRFVGESLDLDLGTLAAEIKDKLRYAELSSVSSKGECHKPMLRFKVTGLPCTHLHLRYRNTFIAAVLTTRISYEAGNSK